MQEPLLPKEIKHLNLNTGKDFMSGLQRYISSYYSYIEKHPEVRTNDTLHERVITQFNRQFLNWLRNSKYASEERKEAFRHEINFLTQYKAKNSKKDRLKELREEMKKKLQSHG